MVLMIFPEILFFPGKKFGAASGGCSPVSYQR
jgi:hypothetical protein